MMEVHRQRCQQCGSIDSRNILIRKPDVPTTIYVRCAKCGELVARYKLSEYYHHGKGLDSFLRSRGAVVSESGRDMLAEFDRAQTESIEGYQQALEYLKSHNKPV